VKRIALGILAAILLTLGVVQPASATTGALWWKANWHGITWTGWWDNWAGNARCVHNVSVHQGWDGKAYAESQNFGYGIGACTDVYGNGTGADVYDQAAAHQFRLRLDYRVSGLTYSTHSGWIGYTGDPFVGIDQYILLASPGQGYPVRVCVEAKNRHDTSGYPWEDAVAAWEMNCVTY
jgi:hypothetical protein